MASVDRYRTQLQAALAALRDRGRSPRLTDARRGLARPSRGRCGARADIDVADLLLQKRLWPIRNFYVTLDTWYGPLAQSITSRHEQPKAGNTGRLLMLPVRASPLLMAWLERWMNGAGI
ncbi:MAG TPA: hypothetical protein VKG61_16825 [Streptosporangiaceae bacterium]|nr:hypothetical protein [Streptosporangiaceae bacterium]